MPVPHFNIKITQRSKGKSAVAGAAYQAGEKLFSEYDQKTKNYTCKKEVVYTEIMLPPNAPPEYADRAALWNSVEEIEKQWNSQLARRFVAALPREVPMELLPQMVKEYCEEHFVSKGMCCDFAIHDPDPPGHNPHCHFMLTMRAIDENGKWLPKFLMPDSNVEVSAIFEKDAPPVPTEFTITVKTDGNGTASASHAKAVVGTEIRLTATPKEGYHFKEWQVISGNVTIKDNKFTMPDGNVEVKAIFEKDAPPAPTEFTITVKTDGNGTASASHAKAVVGTEIILTATPKTGYHFKEWQVISGGVTIKDDKFLMPNDNVEVKAIFEKDAPPAPTEFTITFDGNGGTPSVDSMTTTNQKLTSLPSASRSGSYSFDGWYTKKNGGTNVTTATVFSANTTVYAHWTYTGGGGGGSGYSYYTIKATAGAGGSISPSGNVSVREGRDQTFTITPDKGYAVANVKIDGKSIGAVKSYTFENVSRTHTIEVIFMKANGNPQTGVFVDVATGSYYEDAVDWAVENGITQGTDDTHFSPDGICTRAQAVTFLWRAAGSPEPETRAMPFTDVPVGSYYYDAVLWAVENGITKGSSDTTFSPNMTCTRAQIVAFLWRSEKSPAAGTANPFADVKSTAYYADAVLWAAKEDITKGTTNTTFSPNADCTRAQIVTFLWRCKK